MALNMKIKTGLIFPANKAGKPIITVLVKDYNIEINILKASVIQGQTGQMILELVGENKDIESGIKYLESQSIKVVKLEESVLRIVDKCVDCGACTAVCPSGALSLNEDHRLELNNEKCLVCNACVAACPMRALKSQEEKLNVDI